MGTLQKPQLQIVRTGASAEPRSTESVETPAEPPGVKREPGDLRLRGDLARMIEAGLPEGAKLQEDRVTVCSLDIQFHRIVSGTQYVALLYIDDEYEELGYKSWFVASVCLRIFTTTSGLKFDTPSIEIIARRSGLLPEDWRDELDACTKARIAKSQRITRIESWLQLGSESSLRKVRVWVRELGLAGEDARSDSFGQTVKPGAGDGRSVVGATLTSEPAHKGPLVFVSYSHDPDDKGLFEKLQKYLGQLRNEFGPDAVWADTKIQANESWRLEIERAMNSARVVVALVTPSFLSSAFVVGVELKAMLEGRAKQQKAVAWVLGRTCQYAPVGLDAIQAACAISKPLIGLDEKELDEQLGAVANTVTKLLKKVGYP
jgi:hypothetical protein